MSKCPVACMALVPVPALALSYVLKLWDEQGFAFASVVQAELRFAHAISRDGGNYVAFD